MRDRSACTSVGCCVERIDVQRAVLVAAAPARPASPGRSGPARRCAPRPEMRTGARRAARVARRRGAITCGSVQEAPRRDRLLDGEDRGQRLVVDLDRAAAAAARVVATRATTTATACPSKCTSLRREQRLVVDDRADVVLPGHVLGEEHRVHARHLRAPSSRHTATIRACACGEVTIQAEQHARRRRADRRRSGASPLVCRSPLSWSGGWCSGVSGLGRTASAWSCPRAQSRATSDGLHGGRAARSRGTGSAARLLEEAEQQVARPPARGTAPSRGDRSSA